MAPGVNPTKNGLLEASLPDAALRLCRMFFVLFPPPPYPNNNLTIHVSNLLKQE